MSTHRTSDCYTTDRSTLAFRYTAPSILEICSTTGTLLNSLTIQHTQKTSVSNCYIKPDDLPTATNITYSVTFDHCVLNVFAGIQALRSSLITSPALCMARTWYIRQPDSPRGCRITSLSFVKYMPSSMQCGEVIAAQNAATNRRH